MTKNEIIILLYKKRIIQYLVFKSGVRIDNVELLKEFVQEIFLILCELDDYKIINMYESENKKRFTKLHY